MATDHQHTVKSIDADLAQLKRKLVRMGGLAESQLHNAIEAMSKRDPALADSVILGDAVIDELDQQLNVDAVNFLACRQPVANDLRAVVAVLKIASDLERIGDYAKNVAKRVKALSRTPPVQPAYALPRMARLAQALIKDTLDAYVAGDADRAVTIRNRDREVDEMYSSLFRELLTYMMEDPRNISSSTHLLFIAKNIERIGDHATNIAETVFYLVTGARMEIERPKDDSSSLEVIEPTEAL